MFQRRISSCLVVFIFLIGSIAGAEEPPVPVPSPVPSALPIAPAGLPPAPALSPQLPAKPTFFIGFHGGLTTGKMATPAIPKGSGMYESMNDANGFFLGVDFEGEITSSVKWFLDGTVAQQKIPVAEEGGYATGFWVYEQSGYSSHDVGPFSTDANALIETAGFRLGAKYFFLDSGTFQPWIGLGYGVYKWSFDYVNSERSKSYGKASDLAYGLTYMAGVNFEIDNKTNVVLYGDFASPVANPRIENLFHDGWTWENSGGNHVMGPYRFGVLLQFGM